MAQAAGVALAADAGAACRTARDTGRAAQTSGSPCEAWVAAGLCDVLDPAVGERGSRRVLSRVASRFRGDAGCRYLARRGRQRTADDAQSLFPRLAILHSDRWIFHGGVAEAARIGRVS